MGKRKVDDVPASSDAEEAGDGQIFDVGELGTLCRAAQTLNWRAEVIVAVEVLENKKTVSIFEISWNTHLLSQ